jgi:hypothetical protein
VVTICEVGKPGTRYLVRDISENGIGVTGINAQIDETKSLAVVGDEFGEIAPFEFEAQCRWARQLEPDGAICAGFVSRGWVNRTCYDSEKSFRFN